MKIIFLLPVVMIGMMPAGDRTDALKSKASRMARELLILDTHIDVPYRLWRRWEDISVRTEGGDFDYPRAKAGGLDAVFMSIYTPSDAEETRTSKALADSIIDLVEGFAKNWPSKFSMARSVSEVRKVRSRGRIALILGMENGSPIEGDLENLKHFHDRGVRYITLTHAKDNHICDSSYDSTGTWKGLSPFGRQVVREMNNLGIMIDISHISDEAFYQVIELSRAPVIASHSSCRKFTPDFERNMSDDMIKRLAENGGVIQINFGSVFIKDECHRRYEEGKKRVAQYAKENDLDYRDPKVRDFQKEHFGENPVGFADVTDVADHIDHVVGLAGVGHVGFGSDFDGVGDSLPVGLKDVSAYPNLIYELLKRGYSEGDIKKICGENLLRVWRDVDRISRERAGSR